jgi:hypothetical protein
LQRKRKQRVAASRAGVEAKARKRMERAAFAGAWPRVFTFLVVGHAAPDGKTLALAATGGTGEWRWCGSERAVRAALARVMWRKRK